MIEVASRVGTDLGVTESIADLYCGQVSIDPGIVLDHCDEKWQPRVRVRKTDLFRSSSIETAKPFPA